MIHLLRCLLYPVCSIWGIKVYHTSMKINTNIN